jgi:DNA-binding NarL/FixJ family response regulator
MIRVCIIDDHALVVDSIAAALSIEHDIQVAARCGSIGDALKALGSAAVDIILLDLNLGNESGIDLLPHLASLCPAAKVIVVAANVTDDQTVSLAANGVSGIFLKRKEMPALIDCVRSVAAGGYGFEPFQMKLILDSLKTRRVLVETSPARERALMGYLLEGLTNKEIGDRLGISESAVKSALQILFKKYGVKSRTQLVRIGLERSDKR